MSIRWEDWDNERVSTRVYHAGTCVALMVGCEKNGLGDWASPKRCGNVVPLGSQPGFAQNVRARN